MHALSLLSGAQADYNAEESYCTMAFANRVRKVELGKVTPNAQ